MNPFQNAQPVSTQKGRPYLFVGKVTKRYGLPFRGRANAVLLRSVGNCRRLVVYVLLGLAILYVQPSRAAEGSAQVLESAPPQQEAPKKPVFKKEEKVEFKGLMLQGQLKKPDLSYIYKRRGLRSEQIVNIPENFNEEIKQGAGQF